jgi:hypothetical protein
MSEPTGSNPPGFLDPSVEAMGLVRTSIQTTLRTNLPASLIANAIAPMLSQVNQWSTQTAALFEGSGPPTGVNIIFGIRKDLFIGPPYLKTVFGTNVSDLPSVFQEFLSFTAKLMDLQKPDKEKSPSKVFINFPRKINFLINLS